MLGAVPAGRAGPRPAAIDVLERFVGAHRGAVEAIRSAAPGVPVGLTVAMADWVAVGDTDEELAQAPSGHRAQPDPDGGRLPRGHRRRRLPRRADLLAATASGPTGMLGPRGGRRRPSSWATSSGPRRSRRRIRQAWEVTGGEVPLLVTENGIGTDDDEQRIALRARRPRGRAALPGRRHRRARLHVLEPARQLRVGLRLRRPLRPGRRRPHHLRPHPEAQRPLVRRRRPGQRPARRPDLLPLVTGLAARRGHGSRPARRDRGPPVCSAPPRTANLPRL